MSDFGFFGGYGAYTSLGVTTATTGATANTKGAWSQVIAATTADIKSLILSLRPYNGMAALWDVGVGAAGSEVPVITNLAASTVDTKDYYGPATYFPVAIPAGSRIAIRAQGSLASVAAYINITASEAPFSSLALNGVHTDYGTVLASSLGTAVNVPASGTGAYAQLVAATTNPIKLLTIYVTGTTTSSTGGGLDLAVGAAGAEQIIMPFQQFLLRSTGTGCGPTVMQIPCDIPAGTRISARTTFGGGVGGTIYLSLDGAY